jgi:hypothetical protein
MLLDDYPKHLQEIYSKENEKKRNYAIIPGS